MNSRNLLCCSVIFFFIIFDIFLFIFKKILQYKMSKSTSTTFLLFKENISQSFFIPWSKPEIADLICFDSFFSSVFCFLSKMSCFPLKGNFLICDPLFCLHRLKLDKFLHTMDSFSKCKSIICRASFFFEASLHVVS